MHTITVLNNRLVWRQSELCFWRTTSVVRFFILQKPGFCAETKQSDSSYYPRTKTQLIFMKGRYIMKNTKRIVSLLLAVVMIALTIPITAVSVSASTGGHSQAEALNWANAQVGKSLDYDGAYGAQCVDLIMFYYQYLGTSSPGGDARDYRSNALPSGWQRINYYNGLTPNPGDICVWGPYQGPAITEYGHVGIVTSGNSSTFNSIEQNVSGQYVQTINNRTTSSVACFIRPDFLQIPEYTNKPSNIVFELEKYSFYPEEHVTYYCGGTDVSYYIISIYDSNGNVLETPRINPGEYCTRYYPVGTYLAYCEAYNNVGKTFSNTISFTVKDHEKPSDIVFELEKYSFYPEEHVTYYCGGTDVSYYIISIYDSNGNVLETPRVNPGEYCTRYYPVGTYIAYCEAFNSVGKTFSNTIYFLVKDRSDNSSIGDSNNDGNTDIRDITAIQRHIAKYKQLTGKQLVLADTDGNGMVNINDATRLQMYLAEYDVTLG